MIFTALSVKFRVYLFAPLDSKLKKLNLTRKDLIDYFGRERLKLTEKVIDGCLQALETIVPKWHDLIKTSFLSDPMKTLYSKLLHRRCVVLGL